MKVESIIKKELSAEPKRAKQLVDACHKKGVKHSTVFYWLKKMRKTQTIRKVGGEYELIKLEEADPRDIDFLMQKITDKNPLVRKTAIEDFAALVRETKVANHQQVLSLIKNLLENPPYPELRRAALRFLRFISVNTRRTQDREVKKELASFEKLLEKLVLDEKLEQTLRYNATVVLDVLLNENETPRFIKLLNRILYETARKPEGENQPFQVIGLFLWQSLLKRARFPATRNELRKRLYSLLDDENRRVREMSLHLLDKLRMKEYGFELP